MLQKVKNLVKAVLPAPATHAIARRLNAYRKYTRTRAMGKRCKKGAYQYTVITAVYNAEQYLDDYFAPLVKQTLVFQKHIQLILVDDGSTDASAEIIEKWRARYPNNITYLHQENAGPGAARNAGLPHVKTPWVTFIDSDDFVDKTYFREVDKFLAERHREGDAEKTIHMATCNMIRYYDESGVFSDTHPLRSRFGKGDRVLPYDQLGKTINLTINNSFFRMKEITRQGILFPLHRWPSFEDAYFIARYWEDLTEGAIAFCRGPKYYYRMRASDDSLINTATMKKELYLKQIPEAYLDLLRRSSEKNCGEALEFIQQVVFYDLSYHLKRLFNNTPPVVLNDAEVEEYLSLLRQCFTYISSDIILNFDYAINRFWFALKVGTLFCFKDMEPPFQIVYIEQYDRAKNQVLLVYYCGEIPHETILMDDSPQIPAMAKTTRYSFGEKLFFHRRDLWVQIPAGGIGYKFEIKLKGIETRLSLGGKQSHLVNMGALNKVFPRVPSSAGEDSDKNAWLFIDRDTGADDNAEHLYRYVKNKHPEQKIFFALRYPSRDWARLKKEGFNLVNVVSPSYKKTLNGCGALISSHFDRYVTGEIPNLAGYKQFVFLQHGVISGDMSKWFIDKQIDLFLTSTPAEYASIAVDGSPYPLSSKNVVLTGLPRHDALVPHIGDSGDSILVMPTWRMFLLGKASDESTVRELRDDFHDSTYARLWQSFLNSPRLKEIASAAGMRVVFHPHPNMIAYLPFFQVPSYIQVVATNSVSIQDYFKSAAVMITDYSSVAFEMALLEKPVLYYHFDYEETHGGRHVWSKGYFAYERDGFGPVLKTEDALLDALTSLARRNGKLEEKYLQRMRDTRIFRDGGNCQRVYQAIRNLSKPADPADVPIELVAEHMGKQTAQINAAFFRKNIPLLRERASPNEYGVVIQALDDEIRELHSLRCEVAEIASQNQRTVSGKTEAT